MDTVAGMVCCGEHGQQYVDWCLSCSVAIDWNIHRKFCRCGVPAIGYVVRSREDVGFYCDEHYQPAADVLAVAAPEQGEKR